MEIRIRCEWVRRNRAEIYKNVYGQVAQEWYGYLSGSGIIDSAEHDNTRQRKL